MTTRDETLSQHMQAKITPEKVDRYRQRLGIRHHRSSRPIPASFKNTVSSEDSIRRFVHSYGDDNPLFIDPDYARSSRWGEITAPFDYLNTITQPDPELPALTPEQEEVMSGGDPLRGIHVFVSGTTAEWWRPITVGRRFYQQTGHVGLVEKKSEFAKQAVHLYRASVIRNDLHELIGSNTTLTIHTERDTAAKSGKYKDIERPDYTAEELHAIDQAYENEFRRGADKLYWEDVEVGEPLPTMVKGPLTVTDMICWHAGANDLEPYGVAPLRMGYLNRQRIKGFYMPNEFHAWEPAQACHWSDWMAQAAGNPYCYDYGMMRNAWMNHYVMNWMGDDAWLWKLHSEHRRFNYMGDTTWINGKVSGKEELDGPRFAVHLEILCENQRGEISSPGTATVLLPSRKQDEVILPDPPGGATTVDGVFDSLVEQYASL